MQIFYSLLLLLFLLCACLQEKAPVLLKGENYYGRDVTSIEMDQYSHDSLEKKAHSFVNKVWVKDLAK